MDIQRERLARMAAFHHLEHLIERHGEEVPRSALAAGFEFGGERIRLLGPQGIFKPAQLDLPISITTAPSDPYGDELTGDLLTYHYRSRGLSADEARQHPENVGLRRCMELRLPLVYLFGMRSGWYRPLWPAAIEHDDPAALVFSVAIFDPVLVGGVQTTDAAIAEVEPAEVRYTTRLAKERLRQLRFRSRVIAAYANRCTLCRLRRIELLDAAHIVPFARGGPTEVPNGLSLCKIHHAAYDRNLVGIRPDHSGNHVVQVHRELLAEPDGPMLRHGLQQLHGTGMLLPRRPADHPDPEFLERRYEQFRAVS